MTMIVSVTCIICFAISSITVIEIFAPTASRSDIVTMIAFLMPTISSILNLIKCYENGTQGEIIQQGLNLNTSLTKRATEAAEENTKLAHTAASASETAVKLAAISANKVDLVLQASGIKKEG
jgi:hypothetical protein